ncbi:hypothetical protein [Limnohabitans sp.]|jgi:hypothetical protein|uniref:hypothetical protein n=1 Tax=Limnohabitans sp. TaxID=1907725 RepID=UPI0037C0B167
MRVSAVTLVLAASMAITPPALASEICSQLPDALQAIPVNHISQNSELLSLDNKLDFYLRPCRAQVTEQNKKSICANGKLVAEQTLRVVARIDQAGSRNPFLANAKIRSYANGSDLLERMKQLRANGTCL